MPTDKFEVHIYLKAVGNASYYEDFIIGFCIFLTIHYIIYHSTWNETRLKVGPLLRHDHTAYRREIIIGIGRGKLHFICHTLDLKC